LEFNGLQILDSQNSKGKYESRKIIWNSLMLIITTAYKLNYA
jgi:hypothetical protein